MDPSTNPPNPCSNFSGFTVGGSEIKVLIRSLPSSKDFGCMLSDPSHVCIPGENLYRQKPKDGRQGARLQRADVGPNGTATTITSSRDEDDVGGGRTDTSEFGFCRCVACGGPRGCLAALTSRVRPWRFQISPSVLRFRGQGLRSWWFSCQPLDVCLVVQMNVVSKKRTGQRICLPRSDSRL